MSNATGFLAIEKTINAKDAKDAKNAVKRNLSISCVSCVINKIDLKALEPNSQEDFKYPVFARRFDQSV